MHQVPSIPAELSAAAKLPHPHIVIGGSRLASAQLCHELEQVVSPALESLGWQVRCRQSLCPWLLFCVSHIVYV